MRDILDDFEQQRRAPSYPDVVVEMGMLVEDRSSHFTGDVVRWSAEGVTLQDRHDYIRHFGWKPGGFLIEGRPVTLVRPTAGRAATQRITASGSIAGDGRAKVARASRIWVEGKHDAELLEHVWGDDLRELGIVVEPLHGADDLAVAVAEFGPSAERRLGVLLDHSSRVEGDPDRRRPSSDPNVLDHRAPVRRCVGRHPTQGRSSCEKREACERLLDDIFGGVTRVHEPSGRDAEPVEVLAVQPIDHLRPVRSRSLALRCPADPVHRSPPPRAAVGCQHPG